MIEYDSFIYLDVYRTGSTHVIGLLGRITEERLIRSHRHASLTGGGRLGVTGGKFIFTTVRNPWDWYVSLWAHGADGKSAIRRYLSANLETKDFRAVYDESNPVDSFRRWLVLMHDAAILDSVMMENMPRSGLAPVLGLCTYRFLRVTTLHPRFLLRRLLVRSPSGSVRYHGVLKAYEKALRNETLSADLIELVERNSGRCRFRPDAADIIRAADAKPENASGRTLSTYREYYDERCAELVASRDRFFIDEFGYRF